MERNSKPKKKEIKNLNSGWMEYGKVPPQAIDLEEAILGASLIEYNAQNRFIEISDPKYFYKEAHKLIAEAIFDVNKATKSHADILMVSNHLKITGNIELVGGAYYITQLTNKIYGTQNIDFWCRIIQQMWMKREGIRISLELAEKAYDLKYDVFDMFDEAKKEIEAAEPVSLMIEGSDPLERSLSNIYLLADKIAGKKRSVLLTGNKRFDEKIHLKPSIILLAGAGGIGKTTFTTSIIKKIIDHPDNKKVSILWAVLDHEDGSSVYKKFYGIDGFISIKDLEGIHMIDEMKHNAILSLSEEYKKYDIEFIENSIDVQELARTFKSFCKMRAREDSFKMLVIDNIMRVRADKYPKAGNERDEFVSSVIADMYKDTQKYNSIIWMLHHFTKEQKSAENLKAAYRPKEEHARGSTRFIDIVDLSLFLNRPGKYPELVAEYPGFENILKHLYIMQTPKQSIGEEESIYFWSDMRFSIFDEIDIINDYL